MVEPRTYECGCGATSRSLEGIPKGWIMLDGEPVCPDCQTLERHAQQPQPDPQPVRDNIVAHRIKTERNAVPVYLSSGATLDLVDPDCSVITAADIVSGQLMPMFCGQSGERYTLAQHSVFLSDLIKTHASALGGRNERGGRWAALMSYAHIPFLFSAAFSRLHSFGDFARCERLLRVRFQKQFAVDLPAARRELVKRTDKAGLYIAHRDLLNVSSLKVFDQTIFEPGQITNTIHDVSVCRVWGLEEARGRFLDAFHELRPLQPTEPERKAA